MAKEKFMLDRSLLEDARFLGLSDKAVRLYLYINLAADGMGAARVSIPMMLSRTDTAYLEELITAGFLYLIDGTHEPVALVAHWWGMNKFDRSKMHPGDYVEAIVSGFIFESDGCRIYKPREAGNGSEILEILKPKNSDEFPHMLPGVP